MIFVLSIPIFMHKLFKESLIQIWKNIINNSDNKISLLSPGISVIILYFFTVDLVGVPHFSHGITFENNLITLYLLFIGVVLFLINGIQLCYQKRVLEFTWNVLLLPIYIALLLFINGNPDSLKSKI